MAVTPTGLFSLPLHYCRKSIAASSSFQTWVTAADETAALAYVYPFREPAPSAPFAVVEFNEDLRVFDDEGTEEQEGSLSILLRGTYTTSNDLADEVYTFTNMLGGLISDMLDNRTSNGYLAIKSIDLVEGPGIPLDPEGATLGQFIQAVLEVRYWS